MPMDIDQYGQWYEWAVAHVDDEDVPAEAPSSTAMTYLMQMRSSPAFKEIILKALFEKTTQNAKDSREAMTERNVTNENILAAINNCIKGIPS